MKRARLHAPIVVLAPCTLKFDPHAQWRPLRRHVCSIAVDKVSSGKFLCVAVAVCASPAPIAIPTGLPTAPPQRYATFTLGEPLVKLWNSEGSTGYQPYLTTSVRRLRYPESEPLVRSGTYRTPKANHLFARVPYVDRTRLLAATVHRKRTTCLLGYSTLTRWRTLRRHRQTKWRTLRRHRPPSWTKYRRPNVNDV